MSSDCHRIRGRVSDLIAGALSKAEEQAVRDHLNACADCRKYAQALEQDPDLPAAHVALACVLRSTGQVSASIEALEEARSRLERSRPGCEDGAIVRRELNQAIRLARHGAFRMLRGAGLSCPSDAELRRDLAAAIDDTAPG